MCGPREPPFFGLPPLLFAHLCAAPLFTLVCGAPAFVHTCVALAHARFSRRYAHFASAIPNSPPIQRHESTLIDTSLKFDDQHRDADIIYLARRWQRVPNTVTSPVAYYQKIDNDPEIEDSSSTWGKAVATVDASHTHVFSYIWNQHSYEHTKHHVEREGHDALNKVVYPLDSRSMLKANVVNFGLGVSARVLSTWFVWRQEPDKSFTMAFAPMSDLQHQGLEKLRLELHELRYQLDETADIKLDTQRLKEQVAQHRASIKSLESRDSAVLSCQERSFVQRRRRRGYSRFGERLLAHQAARARR